MSNWENQYFKEAETLTSPQQLDDDLYKTAQAYKPKVNINHLLSRATVSCSVVTALLLLVHPAQHLGAFTHKAGPEEQHSYEPVLRDWKETAAPIIPKPDPWLALRNQVNSGEYVALCHYWRAEQQSESEEPLPDELRKSAKRHCRILSSTASRS
ncbi:hypothetical protein BTJ40_06575 [Microbulbifer sp. A4B17]|uniref:hypothetical protein n=1 Tax=Microbulbifer sp. A4B17 TaxID=359370 RepID=UPI000D52ECDD|nr:hypothetical protein [Microbulbifer sp. A4B17]AWF80500.1 hypothetical protein BTJ40_06575 [Microbulbifer sp. A4B17]